jgi:8-oxo-dGTP pyrophosphatase MutT (NUDIX family)
VFGGDFDILFDRYSHRKEAGERHWVHKDPGERDSFKDALMKYRIGQLEIGTVIPVDATDFSKINFDKLITTAKQFIHETDSEKGYIEKLRAIIGNMRIMLPGCCVFIRNKAGQILMQQRTYPYGKWGLPGGLMELGESPQDTVRHEILEETGLKLGELTLFGVYSGKNYLCIAQNGDEFEVVTSVFVTEDYSGNIAIMDDESLAFEWFDLDKLPQNIAKTHIELIGDYIRSQKEN